MSYDKRAFIISEPFDNAWSRLGHTDDDLLDLQEKLLGNPDAGEVIPETGGLRKIRVGSKGKGKRGGARVIYVDFVVIETIYLFYVYGKNEQENLTEADKKEYKELIAELKNSLA